jgi:hypothetical protein
VLTRKGQGVLLRARRAGRGAYPVVDYAWLVQAAAGPGALGPAQAGAGETGAGAMGETDEGRGE